MPNEGQTVSDEQLAMMDDLDYIPEEDEGTSSQEEEVVETTPPGMEAKEPEVKTPEVKPEDKKEEEKPEVKPEGEKKSTEAELLETYKEQLKHFQKLYEDEKKAKVAATVPPEEQTPVRQRPSQEQIRTHYAPEVKKTVEEGYLSEEFVNSFPDEAVQMLYHRDIIYGLVKRVSEVVALLNQQHGQGQSSQMDATFNTLFDETSKKDEFYAPLSQPEVRAKFKEYLLELNPYVDQINDEFIARQWLAYNKEVILEAAKIAAKGGAPTNTRSNAKGEGSGTRPGKPGSKSQEVSRPWDDI